MANERTLNVGVIGYGLSAKVFHIPFILSSPSLNLYSILQRSPAANPSAPGLSAPHDHPTARHHTSPEPFLADPDLDIVIITTPPNTHYDLASSALRSGKHVLVEKPFVPTSEQARSLAQIAEETGKFICVFQNRRWDVDFLSVRDLLDRKVLGDRVIEFETHFDRYRPKGYDAAATWKGRLTENEGGGALYDLGAHLVDQVYVLFGMPDAVYGKLVNQRVGEGSDEGDSVTAILTYHNISGPKTGTMLVHVRIGAISAEKSQLRFWVKGSEGSFKKFGMDPQEAHLRAGGSATDPGFGKETEPGTLCRLGENGAFTEEVWEGVQPVGYGAVLEGFAAAVRSGKAEDVPVSAKEAGDVLRLLEAIRESARTGAEVKV